MPQITKEQESHIKSKYSYILSTKSEAYQAGMIRAIAAAENLSEAVNEMGFDYETFATVLSSEHRTLQQSSMRAFIEFCKKLAENDAIGFYDERNKASCQLATRIIEMGACLPRV